MDRSEPWGSRHSGGCSLARQERPTDHLHKLDSTAGRRSPGAVETLAHAPTDVTAAGGGGASAPQNSSPNGSGAPCTLSTVLWNLQAPGDDVQLCLPEVRRRSEAAAPPSRSAYRLTPTGSPCLFRRGQSPSLEIRALLRPQRNGEPN